ncbi:hypothetical protein DL96DRAFT_1594653 [Flagelloscypha sp. PMI_526]|nr:hypothetical protein DL96DRAFT_1594653 [Flagelloscypha sp. PMI_526]
MDSDDALLQECSSLRTALSRFQDEAYESSLKLQRFTFDSSEIQDRNVELEQENAALREEVEMLRDNPTQDPQGSVDVRIAEFTLSLRKLSNKLSETERQLQSRIEKDVEREVELQAANKALETAYAMAARCRAEVEEARSRESEVMAKHTSLSQTCQIYDGTIQDYASLVRNLETKSSNSPHVEPSSLLLQSLNNNKQAIEELTNQFSQATAPLRQQITELGLALSAAELNLNQEAERANVARTELSNVVLELEKVKSDDVSAAGMVERYMKFSQTQSLALHSKLQSMQTRHNNIVDNLQGQLSLLNNKLHARKQTEYLLRTALDELGGELMKEKFGRRREVLLKVNLLSTLERLKRTSPETSGETNAEILAAENAVNTLAEELRLETSKRVDLELKAASLSQEPIQKSNRGPVAINETQSVEVNGHSHSDSLYEEHSLNDDLADTHDTDPSSPLAPPPLPPKDHPSSSYQANTPPIVDVLDTASPTRSELDDPVIVSLHATASRYDELSRSLRDCFAILSGLRDFISTKAFTDDAVLPKEVVQAALDRLCDYTEDVRVELEIRSGDEALLVKGFETLLALRRGPVHLAHSLSSADEFDDVDSQIQAFISGSEPGVQKAFSSLSRKTEDIEHDIAVMKRAIYEPTLAVESTGPLPSGSSSPIAFPSSNLEVDGHDETSRWAGWLSRSPSPHPSIGTKTSTTNGRSTSQTFGNIMASRTNMLRHSSSTQSLRRPSAINVDDPFVGLGLRVPMPSHVKGPMPTPPPVSSTLPRKRTMSGMMMLGLGGGAERIRQTSGIGIPRPTFSSSISLHKEMESSQKEVLDEAAEIE